MILKKNSVRLVWLGAAFLGALPLLAKTLVVAKTGGQYVTVQAGLTAANAGDTVLVKAGTYNESVSFGKSGTATGYITLLGETGAILDGTGVGAEELVSIDSKSYVRVVGFEVRNLKKPGTPIGISVNGGGSYIEIRGNRVHNIENANGNAHGIAIYGTTTTPISQLVVDDNEITACKLGQSESMALNGNVSDFTVSNNVVHDNDNIGIVFIGFEGNGPGDQDQARNGICFGNHVYNISSAANPTYGGERSADGIYVDGGRNIVIERNTVADCDIAFEIASEHGGKTASNITIRNNFASGSYQGNILVGGYAAAMGNAENILIVGNTSYHGKDGEVVLQNNCKGVTLKNNIFYASAGNGYLVNSGSNNTTVAADNNLYYGASASSPGPWADAHAVYADPKLQSSPTNLHLAAGSPAINAGAALETVVAGNLDVDGDPRVSGAKTDIGADETGGAVGLCGRPNRLGYLEKSKALRNGLGQSLPETKAAGRWFPTP